MNKLSKIVEILNNDEDTVILKVKDNKKIELLSIGYFNGNEDMIIVAKHNYVHEGIAFRIIYKNGHEFSFTDNTLVSTNITAMKKIIIQTVVFDFGIPIDDYNVDLLKQFNNIKSLEDDLNTSYTFTILGFDKNNMVLRKNDAFMGHLSYDNAVKYLEERYKIISNVHSNSKQTGCDIYTIATEKQMKFTF